MAACALTRRPVSRPTVPSVPLSASNARTMYTARVYGRVRKTAKASWLNLRATSSNQSLTRRGRAEDSGLTTLLQFGSCREKTPPLGHPDQEVDSSGRHRPYRHCCALHRLVSCNRKFGAARLKLVDYPYRLSLNAARPRDGDSGVLLCVHVHPFTTASGELISRYMHPSRGSDSTVILITASEPNDTG